MGAFDGISNWVKSQWHGYDVAAQKKKDEETRRATSRLERQAVARARTPQDRARVTQTIIRNNRPEPIETRSTFEQIVNPAVGSVASFASKLPANIGSMVGTAMQDPVSAVKTLYKPALAPGMYAIDQTRNFINNNFKTNIPQNPITSIDNAMSAPVQRAVQNATPQGIKNVGQNIEGMANRSATNIDRNIGRSRFSPQAKPGENRFITNLSAGAGSLGASLALSKVPGGTFVPAATFGVNAAGDQVRNARANGVSAGEAFNYGVQGGVLEMGLEKVGLDRFLKAVGGTNIVKSTIKNFINEGVQEGMQSLAQSATTAQYSDVNAQQAITEALTEALYGGIIGGGSTAIATSTNKLIQSGMTPQEARALISKTVQKVRQTTSITENALKNITNGQLSRNDLSTLSDYADYRAGRYDPGKDLNNLIKESSSIADRIGLDLRTGSPAEINQRVGQFLENIDGKLQAQLQGGYVQIGKDGDTDSLDVPKEDLIIRDSQGGGGKAMSVDYESINEAQDNAKTFMKQMIDKYQPQKQGRSMKITDMMSKSEKAQMDKLNKIADDLYKKAQPQTPQTPKRSQLSGTKTTTDKLQQSNQSQQQAEPTQVGEVLKQREATLGKIKTQESQPLANITTNGNKKSRFANITVKNSPEVSGELKLKTKAPEYTPETNAGRIVDSQEYVKSKGVKKATTDIKKRLESKKIDSQTVSDAIAVAKALDYSGKEADLLEASAIYEQLSSKLTKAGQTVQAASLLNNRTPEGMQYGAIRALKKAGVEPSAEQLKEIKNLTNNIRNAKGEYEDGLARFKLNEYVSKQVPASKAGKLTQLWKAGLLTSPRTTAGNLAANSFEAVFKKGYVDPVANAFDSVFSLFTGQRSRKMTIKGLASGAAEGTSKGISYFKTGYDPRNPMSKFDIRNIHYSNSPLGKAAEVYTQSVFKLMGAQDQPFYYAALRNSLYDQALTEAHNQKLEGQAKRDFIKKFVTEPQTEAMQLADAEARYAVFQDDTKLGEVASALKQKTGAAGEFVAPFTGVPSSIATRMITRTPIGTAQEVVKQIKSGKFDQRAMTAAIANGSAVIPLVAIGAKLVEAGLMTLGFPDDKKERELWEADGRQPYSIKVGDTWLSTNYFQPAGNLIAAGAEYQGQIMKGENPQDALFTALGGSAQAFTEQSFLQGISGTLNAIQQPERYANRFVEQTAGSVVPNIIRTTARATDPVARTQDSPVDAFKAGVPGLRQTLPVKYDMFGRPVERRSSPINEMVNPFRPSDSKNIDDQILQETRRLQDAGEGIIPTQASRTSFPGYDGRQLDDINREIGSNVRTEWEGVMTDPRYQNLTDSDKKKILDRANDTVYQAIKSQLVPDTKITQRAQAWLNGEEIDYFDGFEAQTETPQTTASTKKSSSKRKSGGRTGTKTALKNAISIATANTPNLPAFKLSGTKAPQAKLRIPSVNTGNISTKGRQYTVKTKKLA